MKDKRKRIEVKDMFETWMQEDIRKGQSLRRPWCVEDDDSLCSVLCFDCTPNLLSLLQLEEDMQLDEMFPSSH